MLWRSGTVTGLINCNETDDMETSLVKMASVCCVDLKIETQKRNNSIEIYYSATGSEHSIIAYQRLIESVANSRGIKITEEDTP